MSNINPAHIIRLVLAVLIALVLLATVVDVITATAAEGMTPYADHCLIGGDEVQVTADDGTIICVHVEGDGYRILK